MERNRKLKKNNRIEIRSQCFMIWTPSNLKFVFIQNTGNTLPF